MKRTLYASAVVLLTLLACGPDNSPPVDGATGGNDAPGNGPDGATGGDGGQVPDAAPVQPDAAVPAVAVCNARCDGVADCDQGLPPYDTDNYECRNNACVYTGCTGDAECQALGAYVCRTIGGGTLATCQYACNGPADCDFGSPPYDADNYTCTNGACVYQGCNGDAECQTLGNYVCRPIQGGTLDTCQVACVTVADCDLGSPPYDQDNYACEGGVCVYQGCNDNAECQANGDFICVTP